MDHGLDIGTKNIFPYSLKNKKIFNHDSMCFQNFMQSKCSAVDSRGARAPSEIGGPENRM